VAAVAAAGYLYVTLDLEGFRSGSLNRMIEPVDAVASEGEAP